MRRIDEPARMHAVDVAHERRVNAVAEQCLDACRIPRRHVAWDREHLVLDLAQPGLAVLGGDGQAWRGALVGAPAMPERAHEHDDRPGGHDHGLDPRVVLGRALVAPEVAPRDDLGRAVVAGERVDRPDRADAEGSTRSRDLVEAVVEVYLLYTSDAADERSS